MSEQRNCLNCKHDAVIPNAEQCCSCGPSCQNWEPDNEAAKQLAERAVIEAARKWRAASIDYIRGFVGQSIVGESHAKLVSAVDALEAK